MCIWRQCNKDPSAALGMTVLGERIGSQGGKACMEAPSPPFFIGAMPESGFLVTSHSYDKKVRKMQEGSLRKMSDRALLGRFLSSYLCYTKEKTVW